MRTPPDNAAQASPCPTPRLPDLSDLATFWTRPIAQRHEAFDRLRAQPGLPFFPEPRYGPAEPGPGFFAVTRLDDVVTASRHPEIFRSGDGISVTDLVPEGRELFDSMITSDDPRHGRLRRIVF